MHLLSTRFLLILTGIFFFLPQAASATYSISDQGGGADCEGKGIGTWDAASKTCTLLDDVDDRIILSDNVTLDGNGKTVKAQTEGSAAEDAKKNPGVAFDYKRGVSVRHLTVQGFGAGISVAYAHHADLTDVHILDSAQTGLYIGGSSTNVSLSDFTLKNNPIGLRINVGDTISITDGKIQKSSTYGLYLRGAKDLTLEGNAFSDNTSNLYFQTNNEDPASWDGYAIDDTNTFDGKVFYYLAHASDKKLGDTVGALICIECDNVSVEGATFPPSETPVILYNSKNVSISSSDFSKGLEAVHLIATTDANITGNTIKDTLNAGVLAEQKSDNLTVASNTFSDIASTAVSVKDSSGISATGNTILSTLTGFNFKNAPSANISGNTLDEGTESYGVVISDSSDSTISDNTFPNARHGGIDVANSDRLTIARNIIDNYSGYSGHNEWGIHIIGSKDSTIEDNTFRTGHVALSLDGLTDSVVSGNNMPDPTTFGISLSNSKGNEIRKNSIQAHGSSSFALYLSKSSENTFLQNTLRSESNYARSINVASSLDNTFLQNDIFFPKNTIGISKESTGNIFSDENERTGNYYEFYDEESEGCLDVDSADGVCDAQFEFHEGALPEAPVIATDFFPSTKPFNEEGQDDQTISPIVFLPGSQGSELWERIEGQEDEKRWVGGNSDSVHLRMHDDGTSKEDMYVGSAIKEIPFDGLGLNIYKTFFEYLDTLKENETIPDWRWLSYDWRYGSDRDSVDFNGEEIGSLAAEVEKMANDSPTHKVTLIGHSKGGNVAKMITKRLEDSGKGNLLDKMIFVATPQLGTPTALAGMLHGDEINLGYGFLLSKVNARTLAENMPGAYELLPTEKYFKKISTPVIEFDDSVKAFHDFHNHYDSSTVIDTYEDMLKFLLGENGSRSEPSDENTFSPNVLSELLLSGAESLQNTLENWHAPEGVQVYEIAGWGLDTPTGIQYSCDKLCEESSTLQREIAETTVDGDETVVVPSAVSMEGAEEYFVNLKELNKGLLNINRDHKNILEVTNIQTLIQNILTENDKLPEYVTREMPTPLGNDKRYRFRMKSPVDVHLYDAQGNHTGVTKRTEDGTFFEEQIPNSYYWELDEKKYLGVDDRDVTIDLQGTDTGTFTFDIDTVEGDVVTNTVEFKDIPVTTSMKGSLTIDAETGASDLALDIDGDGTEDTTVGTDVPMTKLEAIKILRETVEQMSFERNLVKRFTLQSLDIAQRWYEHKAKFGERFGDGRLNLLLHHIKIFERFHWIDEETQKQLTRMIENILQIGK